MIVEPVKYTLDFPEAVEAERIGKKVLIHFGSDFDAKQFMEALEKMAESDGALKLSLKCGFRK